MQELQIGTEQDFKNHNDLPLARIKRIMKSDEDVRMISAEAPVLFAKACEMFILELTLRYVYHQQLNFIHPRAGRAGGGDHSRPQSVHGVRSCALESQICRAILGFCVQMSIRISMCCIFCSTHFRQPAIPLSSERFRSLRG